MKDRYHHIDFLRFVFAVIIVYYHILHANIIPFTNGAARYESLAMHCNYATNIVAAFFMISGVFLYRSYHEKLNPPPIFEYTLGRIIRLAPLLILAILSESFMCDSFNWEKNIINMCFLQCSGLSLEYKGILWYVSSFFFVSILYYAIFDCLPRKKALLLISVLTYFSFVFRINYANGSIGGRETVFYVLNLGVLRAIGEMGLGILLAVAYEKIHTMKGICPPQLDPRIIVGITGIIEICIMIWMFDYFLFSRHVKNHIILIIAFSVLLLIMLSSNSITGKLFNYRVLGGLGKYAYAIYVMQQTSFYVMKKTIWLNADLISIPWLALTVSTLISVLLGISAYYVVERPCTKLYQNWYKRYLTRYSEMNQRTSYNH